MKGDFTMILIEMFRLENGQTMLAGKVEGEESGIVANRKCEILKDGVVLDSITIEGPAMVAGQRTQGMQVVSTLDQVSVERDVIEQGGCVLKPED